MLTNKKVDVRWLSGEFLIYLVSKLELRRRLHFICTCFVLAMSSIVEHWEHNDGARILFCGVT